MKTLNRAVTILSTLRVPGMCFSIPYFFSVRRTYQVFVSCRLCFSFCFFSLLSFFLGGEYRRGGGGLRGALLADQGERVRGARLSAGVVVIGRSVPVCWRCCFPDSVIVKQAAVAAVVVAVVVAAVEVVVVAVVVGVRIRPSPSRPLLFVGGLFG